MCNMNTDLEHLRNQTNQYLAAQSSRLTNTLKNNPVWQN